MGFFNRFVSDIGIDLGTCNTLIYVPDKGVIINEPSVVAVEKGTNRVIAVGEDAKRMLWKTPGNIMAIRPLKDGVIADMDTTEKMIKYFISKVLPHRRLIKPRMVIGIPSCITDVESRAVNDSALKAGAGEVKVLEESLAAAIGANIPIHEPAGNMICDIGGGTTEAAERVKITIGNATPEKNIEKVEIKGTDAITGLPRRLEIDSAEVRDALKEPINQIVEEIKRTLAQTPPELAADIVERGIVMTGGGSLLKGLQTLISQETRVPVILAEKPLECVAIGAGRYYEVNRMINQGRSLYDSLNS